MSSKVPDDDDILSRLEAAWKQGGPVVLTDFLPPPSHPRAMEIAYRLFERDLYHRVQAFEDPPVAERYFQITGYPLREDQKQELQTLEESWRQTVSVELANQFQNIPGHALLAEQPQATRRATFDVESLPILGYGGMGFVYRLKESNLERDVAVKIIRPELFPNGCDRFENEAKILAQLEHPGVVPIHSIGRYHDGRPFFTMKVVQGKTLEKLLDARKTPSDELSRFIDIFEQVCQTIAFAHSKQILHRDLKPGNVMVGAFGEVQVMDWGLGKLLDVEAPVAGPTVEPSVSPREFSVKGRMLGTYSYAAPEQVRGDLELVSPRSDVFGLGAILCEILTGLPPYTGSRLREMAEKGDLSDAWSRLAACGADAELVDIVRVCLAREREARFEHAGEVAKRLAEYRAAAQQRLETARLETEKAEARLAAEHKALDAERRRTRVARWAMGLGLALAAGAILAALIIYHLSEKAEEEVQKREQAGREKEEEVKKREQAGREKEEEVQKREQAVRKTEEAVRRTARLAFGQGQVHCEKGDVPRGLFWFLRSLELGKGDTDLQIAARQQLSLWQSQIPTLLQTWKEASPVIASVFHPNRKTVFIRCDDETIRCREVESGKLLWMRKDIDPGQNWFVSPSGESLLVVQRDGIVQVLDAVSGNPLLEQKMSGKILDVAFRYWKLPPLVALRKDDAVSIFAWEGEPVKCDLTEGEPIAASFDERGEHLLIRSAKNLLCWNTSSKKAKWKVPDRSLLMEIDLKSKDSDTTFRALQFQTTQFRDATISPDGQWVLAARSDDTIQIWNCETGKPIFGFNDWNYHLNVSRVLFNNEGTMVLSASPDALSLWRSSGEFVATLPVQRDVKDAFGFASSDAKNPKIFARGANIGFRFGRVSGSPVEWHSVPLAGRPLAIQTDEQQALVADDEGNCYLWKLGNIPTPKWLPGFSKVQSARYSHDGSAVKLLFQENNTLWMQHLDPDAFIPLDKQAKSDVVIRDKGVTDPLVTATAPNGRLCVNGGRKGELIFQDLLMKSSVGPPVHCGAIQSLDFRPGTRKSQLLILTREGELGVYDIPQPEREESTEIIRRRLEILTGMEMADDGSLSALSPDRWLAKKSLRH